MTAPVLERGSYLVQAVTISDADEAEGVLARWRVLHRRTNELVFVIRVKTHDHGSRLICNCRQLSCIHTEVVIGPLPSEAA